jgi:cyclophilin family peptidyl-prolyl cis-trans isomerase
MRRAGWVFMMAVLMAPLAESIAAQDAGAPTPKPPPAGPVLVIDTAKGIVEIEMYPADAPKTVAQITALAKRNFYNGLRVHRVVPDFVVQFGDPLTRDMTKKGAWGTGGSGRVIGVGETKRTHRLGSVAMAHAGDPAKADSQMYIMLRPSAPALDGKYAVFGQVISGMDVVQKIAVGDMIRRVTVKP